MKLDDETKKKMIEEGQKKLNWARTRERKDFTAKVINIDEDLNYQVRITHRGELTVIENILRKYIDDCNPTKREIPKELKAIFNRIEEMIRQKKGNPA